MNEVVIFGTGEIAVLADFYLTHDSSRRVAAFTVDAAFMKQRTYLDKPVVSFEELAASYPPDTYDLFVAVSYGKLNGTRTAKASAARAMGYHLVSYVSSRATVFPDLTHGDNCFILENNVIQPYVKIGNNVTLWSGNHIGHHSTIKDNVFMASHVVVSGGVTVGEASFVGVNVTLRDHVSIGDHCVLGAGALVLENLPPGSVLAPRGTEISRVPSSRLRRI
ncbi:acetyltransferase [Tardiphaga sp. vice304]|uniref:acetyltransferase n=1 Tax=Tardiphaga sp. vice304 TaxID=2592817 RepID=UPI001161CEBF|nr:acetyltransferase [Tardiphaga sp. vice304]QDM28165.1 acetyltransferase [Tardiphaga sp. vice304]